MTEGIDNMEDCLEKARALVSELEAGNREKAETVLGELTHIHETVIFQELGKLTRALHDTINGFQVDEGLVGLAEQEIPDAKTRLNYVIEMTDKAAHKTLGAVEELMPICEEIEASSMELASTWGRFEARQMSAEEFRVLAKDIVKFFDKSSVNSLNLKEKLNEVLLAQDYQDITGQTIRRVIELVQKVQDNLIEIIKVSGGNIARKSSPEKDKDREPSLEGPKIPGLDQGETVSSQDDVDDLLSSLGF